MRTLIVTSDPYLKVSKNGELVMLQDIAFLQKYKGIELASNIEYCAIFAQPLPKGTPVMTFRHPDDMEGIMKRESV